MNILIKKLKLSLDHPLSEGEKQNLLKIIKNSTKKWSYKNTTCIQGCGVCIYCYAKAMAKRRSISEENWNNEIMKWKRN